MSDRTIRPRKVKPLPPIVTDQPVVDPRTVKPAETPAGVLDDRYINAIEELAGAPTRAHHEAAGLLADELGMSREAALEEIHNIFQRKREREQKQPKGFRRGRPKGPPSRVLEVNLSQLRVGDVLVDTRENAGQIVRSVSVSRSGTGGVILFRGRGNDDGWAVRKTDTLRVRRAL